MAPETGGPPKVVEVDDVYVTYRVFEDLNLGLRDRFTRGQLRRKFRAIRAVQGVSFDLFEGESFGIVGANGSGKSTLLAALTGLLPLESGTIRVRSRPTLLGVGAALRTQLSGRRNIVLGCLAAGMTPDEVESRVDEIIDFSGLAEFIDMPMHAYSSGMKARLTFSIATARSPDILLIDEALAVGDESFKRRSQDRIDQIRADAGAIVLVSHNAQEIRSSCDRAIWLERGVVKASGDPSEVLDQYQQFQRES